MFSLSTFHQLKDLSWAGYRSPLSKGPNPFKSLHIFFSHSNPHLKCRFITIFSFTRDSLKYGDLWMFSTFTNLHNLEIKVISDDKALKPVLINCFEQKDFFIEKLISRIHHTMHFFITNRQTFGHNPLLSEDVTDYSTV